MDIQNLYNKLTGTIGIGPWKIYHDNVKIGCTVITTSELLKVIETYNKLNK